ncbi:MAG: phosphoribosylformimino-5-aminoimidazole carboxamide ribotide isomerase [Lachnospiraceae bacterium]|nr:phosphoribosylformimino-5-aminoimidazole carboxamide ribotide isomerase [Lachnospiraceae bacterium]
MEFRPCIDIHNGKVKQIVGGTIDDGSGSGPLQNFVSDRGADYFALLYKKNKLKGGHIALLNKSGTIEYRMDVKEACKALEAYRGGMQIGGGISDESAEFFIKAGASHVIVTSYIFTDKKLDQMKLCRLRDIVGKEHIVLDLSCRKKDDKYLVVTDRWQTFTDMEINTGLFDELSVFCDEFLIHAVDVEGLRSGIDEDLVRFLGTLPYKVTYAGGIASFSDISKIREVGVGRVNFTIGSGLSIFGGTLDLSEVMECIR